MALRRQRACAAKRAASARCSGVRRLARTVPPLEPPLALLRRFALYLFSVPSRQVHHVLGKLIEIARAFGVLLWHARNISRSRLDARPNRVRHNQTGPLPEISPVWGWTCPGLVDG